MTLHIYSSRQVHETLNGINPSSGFRDMRSQSLDLIFGKFEKFLAHGQAHMGQMGKWSWQCTTTDLDNSTDLWTQKISRVVKEIWVPQIWQLPARPLVRTMMTIPLQPRGLRGEKGKCSNERGIILASNFGKLYERIINERVTRQVKITEAQAGGIPGSATVHHPIVLKKNTKRDKNNMLIRKKRIMQAHRILTRKAHHSTSPKPLTKTASGEQL